MQIYPEQVECNLVGITWYIYKVHSQETKYVQIFSKKTIVLLFITCKSI